MKYTKPAAVVPVTQSGSLTPAPFLKRKSSKVEHLKAAAPAAAGRVIPAWSGKITYICPIKTSVRKYKITYCTLLGNHLSKII